MPLYEVFGIMHRNANLSNHGQNETIWAGSMAEARKAKKELKAEKYDVKITQYDCPKDKINLLNILNGKTVGTVIQNYR